MSYFAATTAGFSRTSSEELVFRNVKVILEMREFFRNNSTILNLGYFMRFCYLVLVSFFLNSPAYAENLLNPNECALQIASRASFSAAQRVLKNYHFTKKNAVIYKAQNGYYAVSVGTLRPSEVSSVMNKWKANGRIPSDSRCSKGSGFLYALNPVTGQKMKRTTTQIAAKKPARVASKRVYIDCKRIDLRKEVAACYALTVGPKACTQAINESSLNRKNSFTDRVALGAACTGVVKSVYAKDFVGEDIFNAFLDEGLETMCSDGGLLTMAGCLLNAARWLQKIGTAMECEQKLVNACGRN